MVSTQFRTIILVTQYNHLFRIIPNYLGSDPIGLNVGGMLIAPMSLSNKMPKAPLVPAVIHYWQTALGWCHDDTISTRSRKSSTSQGTASPPVVCIATFLGRAGGHWRVGKGAGSGTSSNSHCWSWPPCRVHVGLTQEGLASALLNSWRRGKSIACLRCALLPWLPGCSGM